MFVFPEMDGADFKIDPISMHLTTLSRFFAILLAVLLPACSTSTNPIMQTMQYMVKPSGSVTGVNLNPDFRFMKVVVDGRVVFLALGNEDKDTGGVIEVWYSAEREVLRFQNGRLVGAVGLSTEWRSVALPVLPSWEMLSRAENPTRWTRTRDVMPGYRYGMQDALVVRRIAAPGKSEMQGVDPGTLTWFEEQVDTGTSLRDTGSAPDKALPLARYAVELRDGKEAVVYGEQCLAPELCFSWQRWPVAANRSSESQAAR